MTPDIWFLGFGLWATVLFAFVLFVVIPHVELKMAKRISICYAIVGLSWFFVAPLLVRW